MKLEVGRQESEDEARKIDSSVFGLLTSDFFTNFWKNITDGNIYL
jgi:hypothetical protein